MSDDNKSADWKPADGKPPGWPANKPADWQRFVESDLAAGFEIGENFKRFSQRDDIFNRAWWDDKVHTDDVVRFYDTHRNPQPRKADGYNQWDFALLNSSWSVARDYAGRGLAEGKREGFLDPFRSFLDTASTRAELLSIEETTARIRHVAKFLGADLIGITEYDERWVYSHAARADSPTRDEKPNVALDGMTSVIVIGHAMDEGLVRSYPSATAAAATGREYSREAAIVSSVAAFIKALGYEAVGSSNDTGLTIPYAIKAGMGEYGRNQMVITKEYRPRIRFYKVFTDLPLLHDKPKKIGVREVCDICTKCADACPPKALPFGPPQAAGPNRSTITGVTKWSADCEKCFGYWTKLKADCAICMRVCPFNKDYARWTMRLFGVLLRSPLRRPMLWLDDKLKFGRRRKPSEWWRLPLDGGH
ncbi:MAG: hypothetical protein K8F25_13955 [Fimbriimonadaceae bacterium]|nr:hypothetical protein [Alphaproteobacteria bacterium]